MIKLKSLLKESLQKNVLYHATFSGLLDKIKTKGLIPGGNECRAFDWCNPSYVYLVDDAAEAIALVENSDNEDIPEEWFEQIVCLAIDRSKLDPHKLYKDENYNVEPDDTEGDDTHYHKSFMYKGIIPPSAIVSWNVAEPTNENMFPKKFDRHSLGSCMAAAELATKYLLQKGIKDFEVLEGLVSLSPDLDDDEGGYSSHTWIQFKNGKIFDPTKNQWRKWGYDPDGVKIMKITKRYDPEEYLDVASFEPSKWEDFKKPELEETMTYNDLIKTVDTGRKDRSAQVRTRSIPVSVDENQESWNFRYKANPSTTGKPFQGQITFFKEVKNSENVNDIPCKVDCGCPDFMYRFAYNNAREDAAEIGPKTLNKCINRKPRPAYDYGVGMCKHLTALSGYLGTKIKDTKRSNLFEAMADVAREKNFVVPYYD